MAPQDQSHLVAAAVILTVAAATIAWLLASVAHLPENVTVISVMVLAFLASWNITNHRTAPQHRVTVVRARVRTR